MMSNINYNNSFVVKFKNNKIIKNSLGKEFTIKIPEIKRKCFFIILEDKLKIIIIMKKNF